MNEVRRRVEEEALAGGSAAFNRSVLTAERTTPDEVAEAARTLPMLGGRKLVVVEAIDDGDKRKLQPVHDALTALIAAGIDTTTLLLTATSVDRRRKLYKATARRGLAVECKPLWGRDLERWIAAGARRRGKAIAPDAVGLLVDMVGNDLGKLDNELDKLAQFVFDRGRIELADAEEAVADLRLSTVFDLVDALGERRLEPAVLALHKLESGGADPGQTLFFVSRHFRQLARAVDLQRSGMGAQEACRAAGMKLPWKAQGQLRRWSPAALRQALLRIARTADELRRSRVAGGIQLDRLAMDLCGS